MTSSISPALLLSVLLAACCCTLSRADLSCSSSRAAQSGYWCEELASNLILGHRYDATADRMHFSLDVEHPDSGATGPVDWAGFGISELGSMKGSSIVTLTQSNGQWSMQDRFAVDFARPAVTNSSDARLHSVEVVGSVLRATFSRALESCVQPSVRINLGLRNQVVFAFGADGSKRFNYHGTEHRGFSTVLFRVDVNAANQASSSSVSLDAAADRGESTLELRMPPTPIPMQNDHYVCVDAELPQDAARHIIRWEGLLQGAPDNVHHMVIFACMSKPSTFGKGTYECSGMPTDCMEFVTTWAPGAGVQGTPAAAGIRMGPGGYRYVSLQMHYNNVAQLENKVDSSGFRLTTTTTLRQYDVGHLLLGNVMFSLPASTPSVSLGPSWCPSGCTTKFNRSLNMFDVNLHMHQVGSKIVVKHLRGKQELRPLGAVNYFDFGHQVALPVPAETSVLLPGDTLITECTYDTTGRKNKTRFGEGTLNEMCFVFVSYYPKLPAVDVCITAGNQSVVPLVSTCASLSSFGNANELIGSVMSLTSNMTLNSSLLTPGLRYAYTPYALSGSGCQARRANQTQQAAGTGGGAGKLRKRQASRRSWF